MPLPRVRALDWFEVNIKGEAGICLRDPEHIQEDVLALRPEAFAVAQFLDGKNDVAAIQAIFAKHLKGEIIPSEFILKVVEFLDESYLLESPRFKKKRAEIERAFVEASARPAFLAGRSYPPERRELRQFLEGMFTAEGGPGGGPDGRGVADVCGLIAPHIDFHRGGPAYAHAYRALAESAPADVYVVLGVAHSSPPSPFILTDKDFETPFGLVRCDREFVERLRRRAPGDPFRHQLTHRTEHSVEFQAVYLRFLLGHKFKIVPILCSSFEPLCGDGDPKECGEIEEFIAALEEAIAGTAGRVCVIAGADLAHVGKRFNDPFDITPQILEWVEREDRRGLDRAGARDAEGWYRSVMEDGNKRKVCGLSSIYTSLRLIPEAESRLLTYGNAPDPSGGIVSFASMVFARPNGGQPR